LSVRSLRNLDFGAPLKIESERKLTYFKTSKIFNICIEDIGIASSAVLTFRIIYPLILSKTIILKQLY